MEEKIIERILGHLSQSEVQIRKSLINFATKMISKKKIYPEDLDVEMVWLKEIFDDELTNALKAQRESIVGELEKKHSFPVTGLMTPEEQQWNYGQSVGYNQAIQEAIKIVEGK